MGQSLILYSIHPTLLLYVPFLLTLLHYLPLLPPLCTVYCSTIPGVLYNCAVENWSTEKDTVENCVECFTEENTSLAEKYTMCTQLYLPVAQQVCSLAIEQTDTSKEESVKDVVECFEETLEEMTAERCLKIAPGFTDLNEELLEGALCLGEAKHNITMFIANILSVDRTVEKKRKQVLQNIMQKKQKEYLQPKYTECLEMKDWVEEGHLNDDINREIQKCFI